eukprot:SAG31_NODE_21808_length_540_cov_1.049887_1_plen_61_part_00
MVEESVNIHFGMILLTAALHSCLRLGLAGAKVNERDDDGYTPAYFAELGQHWKLLSLLRE